MSNDFDAHDVKFAYAVGEGGWRLGDFELKSTAACKTPLVAIEPGTLIVNGNATVSPEPNTIVKITAQDGWNYPYTVKNARRDGELLRIEVVELTAMELDAKSNRLKLLSFPQREHTGDVQVQWMPIGLL